MIDLNDYKPSEEDISSPTWWNSNTPEGTTHYLPEQAGVARAFIKENGDVLYYSYGHDYNWAHWGLKRMKSCYKLIERPKEKKGMKGSDKVMVELTGYQVAKLYALLGVSNGEMKYSDGLFGVFRNILGQEMMDLHHFLKDKQFPAIIHFIDIERELYKAVLEPETPVLTEAQKKALELKETIAKAQQQLEELEKQI